MKSNPATAKPVFGHSVRFVQPICRVLDLSFRRYRAGAAPRNWQRNGELLHPGNPDKDLDEKAARKIAK